MSHAYKFKTPINLNGHQIESFSIEEVTIRPTGAALIKNRAWIFAGSLEFFDGVSIKTLAVGGDVANAVTRFTAAAAAGHLLVSAGNDRTTKTYDGGAGLVKSDTAGLVSPAIAEADFVSPSGTGTLTNKTLNATTNTLNGFNLSIFDALATFGSNFATERSKIATIGTIADFVAQRVAALGQIAGDHDASTGTLPLVGTGELGAIMAGDYWRISVGGTISGLSPVERLEIGDVLVARVTNASVVANFFALQGNVANAISFAGIGSVLNREVPINFGTTGRELVGSGITVTGTGDLNISASSRYLIGGVNAIITNFDSLQDVQGAGLTLSRVSRRYGAHFLVADWSGITAPYTITINAPTHGLGATSFISVSVRENGSEVGVDTHVSSTGVVTITSLSVPFACSVLLTGGF